MREILELCVEMDRLSERAYSLMSGACDNATLSELFATMAAEEATHTGWWTDLIDAFDQGLLPDIVNDGTALADRLRRLKGELEKHTPEELTTCTADQALTIAARIEFFMIDPIFGELIDLTEPGYAEQRHVAYSRHLERLISAIELHYDKDSLAVFLAGILSRTWSDNVALSMFATRDALTGIHNRRALDTHLEQWAAWSARYGRPLTVLLIDIDWFKEVNDRHGHVVGDAALRAVAIAISTAVRASDLVVRYGGDEFAVITPETDADEYCLLVDRILETVRSLEVLDDNGHKVELAVSIGGVVSSDPAGSAPRSVDKLLATADQALYAAKKAGRNRASDPIVLERHL